MLNRFLTIKGNVIHAHLGCNIVPLQGRHIDMASLIKEMSGKRTSVFDSPQVIISTISLKKMLLTALTDKLK
jgi:hypothetical protein